MKATAENIYEVLLSMYKANDEISWQQIVDTINKTGMKVTNWLKVRAVLQAFRNQEMLIRSDDVRVEVYYCRNKQLV